MKITKNLIIIFVCILLASSVILVRIPGKTIQIAGDEESADHPVSGKKPFEKLKASDIVFATARLCPPDKSVEITDIEELVDDLNDVMIHQTDNSYTEYVGQAVIFTLTMTDGTQKIINEFNPFLIIDDVGYSTEYEPCEKLNSYANSLLDDDNARIIMEEPPELYVFSDKTYDRALQGPYSWQKESISMEADSAHPLDCRELLDPLETGETAALLRFTEEPDEITDVRCWSDEHWNDFDADSENVSVNGNEIELKPGGYIYEVTVRWDTEHDCGGTAHYYFYAKVPEPELSAKSD